MPITQDDLRNYLAAHQDVVVQIAGPADGSPEIAWGDTFFYVRNPNGETPKMPFATIVIKDYDGFDCDSQLNRGGLFRLNLEVGKEKFSQLWGFPPSQFEQQRGQFDFAALDQLFPHPVYGAHGWVSIINPQDESLNPVHALLDFSLNRARRRTGV